MDIRTDHAAQIAGEKDLTVRELLRFVDCVQTSERELPRFLSDHPESSLGLPSGGIIESKPFVNRNIREVAGLVHYGSAQLPVTLQELKSRKDQFIASMVHVVEIEIGRGRIDGEDKSKFGALFDEGIAAIESARGKVA